MYLKHANLEQTPHYQYGRNLYLLNIYLNNLFYFSCTIKHPTKGYKTYQGFYQNKKNDAEASAAQLVIRDWDITLLDSTDIPGTIYTFS